MGHLLISKKMTTRLNELKIGEWMVGPFRPPRHFLVSATCLHLRFMTIHKIIDYARSDKTFWVMMDVTWVSVGSSKRIPAPIELELE